MFLSCCSDTKVLQMDLTFGSLDEIFSHGNKTHY